MNRNTRTVLNDQEYPTASYLEETMDPDNWDALRQLAHRMVDDMLEYLEDARKVSHWKQIPAEAKSFFKRPIPRQPVAVEEVYQDFREFILPYPFGNTHPRFWGWVAGTGTPIGMLAEMLTAGMNTNNVGFEQIAFHVERQVIEWFKELLGFPASASGLLLSGSSMGNLIGLTVARNTQATTDLRRTGLQGEPAPLIFYASAETHSSVFKAIEFLGIGSAAVRVIPVTEQYRVDVDALRQAIQVDRTAGRTPGGVIGNAGTVNTGAIDPLEQLADLCRDEGLWLHVDGAFGALAALAHEFQHLVQGLERSDSIAFSLHKWMHMPYGLGCVLVRDEELHRNTFALTHDYTSRLGGGVASVHAEASDYGIELSRGFSALKAWMSLRAYGADTYGHMIAKNIHQARYLADLIESDRHLELLAPAELNIVCFRYNPGGMTDNQLNKLNENILIQLQERGIAVPSHTKLGDRLAIRIAITNHRTKQADLEAVIEGVLGIAGAAGTPDAKALE
ncbi:MAG: aminotransferase class V-fold PLP-dependent enzyme [Fidelibacterota bacterium]|nr:MAG: aminotransferase class V-fold PLP-dependent enzyme [Candidatus Neomarinimicrobiota bacterium]